MKILLSNAHLSQFGGSELVTVELAEHYASLGHDVTLYSPLIMPPLINTIKHREKMTLTMEVPDNLTEYDLVWSHHNLLLDQINRKTKRKHQLIVANIMSSYLLQEKPLYSADKVDLVFANSEETKQVLPEDLKFKCQLFQNPSPPCTTGHFLTRSHPLALSISNHRPPELTLFMVEHSKIIDFELFGKNTKNYQRLNPNVLRETNADFVICNGKSVQAALLAELPVFLFDSMGGCGWLTEENFEVAEYFNFSGRGFYETPPLSSILNFDDQSSIELTDSIRDRFQLDRWITKQGLY